VHTSSWFCENILAAGSYIGQWLLPCASDTNQHLDLGVNLRSGSDLSSSRVVAWARQHTFYFCMAPCSIAFVWHLVQLLLYGTLYGTLFNCFGMHAHALIVGPSCDTGQVHCKCKWLTIPKWLELVSSL
jgi:hypothetical protein